MPFSGKPYRRYTLWALPQKLNFKWGSLLFGKFQNTLERALQLIRCCSRDALTLVADPTVAIAFDLDVFETVRFAVASIVMHLIDRFHIELG